MLNLELAGAAFAPPARLLCVCATKQQGRSRCLPNLSPSYLLSMLPSRTPTATSLTTQVLQALNII